MRSLFSSLEDFYIFTKQESALSNNFRYLIYHIFVIRKGLVRSFDLAHSSPPSHPRMLCSVVGTRPGNFYLRYWVS